MAGLSLFSLDMPSQNSSSFDFRCPDTGRTNHDEPCPGLAVAAVVERQLVTLSTAAVAKQALRGYGQIAVCADEPAMIAYADIVAAEHLQVHMTDSPATAAKRNLMLERALAKHHFLYGALSLNVVKIRNRKNSHRHFCLLK